MIIFNRAKAIGLALFFILTGCSLSLETRFESNWSGKVRLYISYNQMKAMISALDSTDGSLAEFFNAQEMESIETELSLTQGISEIKVINDSDEGSVIVSARFKDLEALNQLFENFLLKFVESKDKDIVYSSQRRFFSLKGKNTLIYEHSGDIKQDELGFSGELLLGFAKKIRSINHPSAVLSADKMQATIHLDSLKKGDVLIIKL